MSIRKYIYNVNSHICIRVCACLYAYAYVYMYDMYVHMCDYAYRIFDQDAPDARSFRADTASGVFARHVAHRGVVERKGGACTHSDASIQRIADVLHVNPR